jgi:TRAP-type C4-dicarboxylate transport system permease small subunit
MSLVKLLAILLIVGGLLALIYGGFSYTDKEHRATVGPLKFSVQEKEHVAIPTWAGGAAIVAGAGLLLVRSRR